MRTTIALGLFLSCASVPAATAQQGGWLIESSNVVSPSQPTTTIEVWAWFDDPTGERDAFAVGDFDFLAGDGEFSNVLLLGGFTPGSVIGNSVSGVTVGQVWGAAGLLANTQNPILVFSADWTTTEFTPRTVSLDTRNTTTFQIGTNSTHSGMNLLELYPQGFTPGTGVIQVVPTPASAVPMVVVGAVMLRRRR